MVLSIYIQLLRILLLLPAQTASLEGQPVPLVGDVPALAADGGRGPEDVAGVDLLLDAQEAVVVCAVEGLLEVGLHDVALVEVAAAAGGDLAQALHPVVRDLLVDGLDLGEGSAVVPGAAEDAEHDGLAPRGVDGAVGGVAHLGTVHVVLDQRGAFIDDATEGCHGLDQELLRLPVGAREQARGGVQVRVADRLDGEVARPGVVEVVVLEEDWVDAEADGRPILEQRREHGLELGQRDAGDHPGEHVPDVPGALRAEGEHARVAVAVLVGVLGESAPVGLHGGPVDIVGDVGARPGHDGPRDASEVHLGVRLDGHADDDAEGPAAAAAESPEQVLVLLLGGRDEAAVGQHHVDAEDLVRCHAELGGQRRVAATGDVAARDADALALAAHGGDTVLVSGGVQLADLDAGAQLEGGAAVRLGLVVLDEVDLLEVVRPDGQGTGAGGLAKEVVAGVVDDEAEVEAAGEVDGELDLSYIGDLDGVRGGAAELAGARVALLRQAGLALVKGGHDRRGVTDAAQG